MVPRLATLAAGLRRDGVRQAAYALLILRVVEGLAAWVLFNEVFLAHVRHPYPWLVHVAFLLYFAVNLFVALRYHAGEVSLPLVALDLLGNLLPLSLVIAASGGIASPILLLLLLKMFAYAFIFGPECGVASIAIGAGSLTLVAAGHAFGLQAFVPISVLAPEVERRMNELVRVLVLTIACGGAVHFLRQTSRREAQLRLEMERVHEAAERQRTAANVTGALLAVSEAISRLTRLDDILAKVVEVVPRVLSVDYCSLFLWREDSGVYTGAAAAGVEAEIASRFSGMRLRPEEVPDLEWVRRLGHCAMVSPSSWQGLGVPEVPTLLIAPLLSGGRFFGVLQLARGRGGATFTQGDLKLADGVAGQTAVALERARLVEEGLRLLRAVESTGEAILIADAHGRIRFVNSAFRRTFGYADEPLVGRDASCLTSQLRATWLDEVSRAVTAQGWRGEAVAYRRDGSEFPMLLDTSLIRDERNRVVGAVAILKDISDRKEMQERLRRADRLAASGELAAGIAHEVNNALVGILVQTELAQTDASEAELRTALTRVEGQGRRIASIVRALLGFARPQPPSREAVELHGLVAETLALIDHDLRHHAIAVTLDCPTTLPPILADAKQIEQVLVNLFTNAVQAMAKTGGRLTIRGRSDDERVRLEVGDTGPGIAAEHLGRIFDPFFTTKPEGSGLGLSVSYGIVRAHDGDLVAHSEPGRGTTFLLTLPSAPPVVASGLRTALVVDDEDQVAESLLALLAQEGLSAQRAASGAEALARLASQSFDVVLLDVRLPDIAGPAVYAQLLARQPAQAERVIFVTGGLWRSESRLRLQLPPQPVLSKPCTGTQLRDALRALAVRPAA
ncbi:MAG TPA: ATP-binding protein [Candidatus Kryptonia bacterium]|nr:ATP-binding protein [Candidatus Kryptonia bacterium]